MSQSSWATKHKAKTVVPRSVEEIKKDYSQAAMNRGDFEFKLQALPDALKKLHATMLDLDDELAAAFDVEQKSKEAKAAEQQSEAQPQN